MNFSITVFKQVNQLAYHGAALAEHESLTVIRRSGVDLEVVKSLGSPLGPGPSGEASIWSRGRGCVAERGDEAGLDEKKDTQGRDKRGGTQRGLPPTSRRQVMVVVAIAVRRCASGSFAAATNGPSRPTRAEQRQQVAHRGPTQYSSSAFMPSALGRHRGGFWVGGWWAGRLSSGEDAIHQSRDKRPVRSSKKNIGANSG
jgi:hypothetical protein